MTTGDTKNEVEINMWKKTYNTGGKDYTHTGDIK
jgi:hypothetical protein